MITFKYNNDTKTFSKESTLGKYVPSETILLLRKFANECGSRPKVWGDWGIEIKFDGDYAFPSKYIPKNTIRVLSFDVQTNEGLHYNPNSKWMLDKDGLLNKVNSWNSVINYLTQKLKDSISDEEGNFDMQSTEYIKECKTYFSRLEKTFNKYKSIIKL